MDAGEPPPAAAPGKGVPRREGAEALPNAAPRPEDDPPRPPGRHRHDDLVTLAYEEKWDEYWRRLAGFSGSVYDFDAINAFDLFGATALYYTAMLEAREGVEGHGRTLALLAAGADPNAFNRRCASYSGGDGIRPGQSLRPTNRPNRAGQFTSGCRSGQLCPATHSHH